MDTMSTFRAAIWVAVSTQEQAAEDKVSLEVQEEKCRQLIQSRGWQEAAGPYVVPGQSRTRWVNLRDAEQAIPNYLELAPRKEVNQAVREFIESIMVSPAGEIVQLKLR